MRMNKWMVSTVLILCWAPAFAGWGGSGDGGAGSQTRIASRLPATGQRLCMFFDGGSTDGWLRDPDCTKTYGVGDPDRPFGQDAHYADRSRPRSFTGPTAPAGFDNDYVTTDGNAGLIWKTCVEGLSGADCGTGSKATFTFDEANTTVDPCGALNEMHDGAGYAGITDWRMPTPVELVSIVDIGLRGPDPADFPRDPHWLVWTGFEDAEDPTQAWSVFTDSHSIQRSAKTTELPVRCVSSGGVAAPRDFVDLGDGTVFERATGLLWQKCSVGETYSEASGRCEGLASFTDWASAMTACENLTLADIDQWRLPNIVELHSLADHSQDPAIDTNVFSGVEAYWADTSSEANPIAAYEMKANGDTTSVAEKVNVAGVRCVFSE